MGMKHVALALIGAGAATWWYDRMPEADPNRRRIKDFVKLAGLGAAGYLAMVG